MPFLFSSAYSARLIEYLRADVDPAIYNPLETDHIADLRSGGSCWAKLGVLSPSLAQLRMMAKGVHPVTTGRLSARRETPGSKKKNTPFHSVVFNVPKSVSLVSELGGDHRIRDAVHDSATETLEHIEAQYAGLRPRKKTAADRNRPRNTGSMCWVSYLGNESRRLDPTLHVHGAMFNVTFDPSDPKRPFKALDVTRVYASQKGITKYFETTLRTKLAALGHPTVDDPRNGSFEIVGVSKELIRRFSKSNRIIKAEAKAVVDAERAAGRKPNVPAIEAKVARQVRPRKKRVLQHRLLAHWEHQVTTAENAELKMLVSGAKLFSAEPARQPILEVSTANNTLTSNPATIPMAVPKLPTIPTSKTENPVLIDGLDGTPTNVFDDTAPELLL